MSKFKNTEYYKSDKHIESAKNASVKGVLRLKELKLDRIEIYNLNPKKCKYCNEHLSYDKRYNSFCNNTCSATFNNNKRILSDETKDKISKKLSGRIHNTKLLTDKHITKICPECNTEYKTRKIKQIYCSRECARKNNGCCESAKRKISIKVQERIKNGTFSGWMSRAGKLPSYPEKYFINLLNNENIIGWERDYKVGKYFIDFAFIDKKISLEIDGKQHQLEERKIKDIEKDDFLKESGWKVIRIKWYNPINDSNKEKLYKQIERLKNIL